MDRLRQDVLYSWRRLRRSPGFTLIAVATLALGIGANTALFDVVNRLLLRALPVPGLERMIGIHSVQSRFNARGGLSDDELRPLQDLVARHDTIDSLAAIDFVHGSLTAPTGAAVIVGEAVSGGYFQTAGVTPLVGRLFNPADDDPRSDADIVLSEHTWRRSFNSDPAAIGRIVRLTGLPMTIVGVVPDSFHGLWLPTLLSEDVWVPLRYSRLVDADLNPEGRALPASDVQHRVLARLRPGVDPRQAAARLTALGAHLAFTHGETGLAVSSARAAIVPEEFDHYGRLFGLALVGLSGLVLLIACSNLTNLLLARTANRSIEIAVRMSAGASRGRIAQLLLVEAGLVTTIAGAAGLAVASATAHALAAVRLPELEEGMSFPKYMPSLDLHVFLYGFLLAVIVALAVGAVPAWRATKTDPVQVFASAGGTGGSSSRSGRLRPTLIALQLAASTVLLLAAGLFVRSTLAAMAYDPRIDVTHTAIADINLAFDGLDEVRGRAYFRRLLDQARQMPGLVSSALTSDVPVGNSTSMTSLLAEGQTPPASDTFGGTGYACHDLRVTPGFFKTIGVAVKRGRDFTSADTAATVPVVIINESVAKKLWPGQDPIGRRLSLDKDRHLREVVGLVADTDHNSPYPQLWRYAFVPLEQDYSPRMSIVGRGPDEAETVRDLLRAAGRAADPDVALFGVRTMAERVAIWLVAVRFTASLLTALGVLGGVIAILGMYGVTAYVVTCRTREFGILRALGASDGQIYRSVLAQGARPLAAGVAAGMLVAYLAAGLLEHLLYGVHSHDLATFVAVPAALVTIGLMATFVPARRAAAIDPNVALRDL